MAAPMFTLKGKGSLLGGDVVNEGALPQEPLAGCTAYLTFNAKGFLGVNDQMSSVEPVVVQFDDDGWLNGPNGVGLLAADPGLHLTQRPTWHLAVRGEFDGVERTFHSFRFAAGDPGDVIHLDAVARAVSTRNTSDLVGKQGPRSRAVPSETDSTKLQWEDEFGKQFGDPVDYSALSMGFVVNVPPPSSAAAAGVAGQRAYDANYSYVCVAANTWKRSAISTW